MSKLPWLVVPACLALLVLAPPAAAAPAFSVEQALSAPFPEQLVAAPAGGAVAWVANAGGVRNVWVAEPPAYRGRQLTGYGWDSGREIFSLAFTADGRAVVFERRPDPTAAPAPNPLSLAPGSEPEIWVASLAGGKPVRIAEGEAPLVSPRGREVVFLKGGKVFRAPLAGKGEPQEILLPPGEVRDLRFSPDGERLAFTSDRDRHSFVGVLELANGAIHWLEPGVDQDVGPVWSPDGRHVAFIRLAAVPEDIPFFNQREGEPWSIRIGEWASGRVREVFRAERGRGSVYRGIASLDQVLWTADGRLVFPWEKDGWTHLYSVTADLGLIADLGVTTDSGVPAAASGAAPGARPTLLTPGDFEVEEALLSANRTAVFFTSNQGDVDRRHLWKLAAGSDQPVAVTGGTGIEWSPVPTADGKALAFLRSDVRRPARPAILVEGAEARDLAPGALPAEFPADALVEPQPVILTASDGLPIHAQLFLPAGLAPGERRPAVAFFHGGSRRQMLLGWHYMLYYHHAYALNQLLANRGFVVLSVNYRSGIGYGLEFREALSYGAGGGSELADVLGAGLYLAGRTDVDPARIGLWGGSYGGYLTAMGLAHASHLFAAGVDVHGVHDWNNAIRNFAPSYEPLENPERARHAFEASPLSAVSGWRSPVLLIHGDDDRNVPFTETVDLVVALRKQGVETEELVFPDDRHDFHLHANWVKAYRAALDFLERKLAPRRQ